MNDLVQKLRPSTKLTKLSRALLLFLAVVLNTAAGGFAIAQDAPAEGEQPAAAAAGAVPGAIDEAK
ncbi:MAG: hypothetical protein ACR2NM_01720, partial [Bythopirellula sp.]